MVEETQEEVHHEGEVVFYGDSRIASAEAPVPGWLRFSYIFWTLWGFVWFYFFWNGSYGWLDPGYWQQLQRAANTTFPTEHISEKN